MHLWIINYHQHVIITLVYPVDMLQLFALNHSFICWFNFALTKHEPVTEQGKFVCVLFNGKVLPTRPDGCLMLDTQHSESGANVCVVIRIRIV